MCGDFPSRSVTDEFFPPRPHADFKGFDFNDDIIHVLFSFFFVKIQLTNKILCMLRLRNSLICLFYIKKLNNFKLENLQLRRVLLILSYNSS